MDKALAFFANNPFGAVVKVAIAAALSYALTSEAFDLDPWTTMVLTGVLAVLAGVVNPQDTRFGIGKE